MEPLHSTSYVPSPIVYEAMAMRVTFHFNSGMYVVPGLTQESADDIFLQLTRANRYVVIDDDVIFTDKLTHVQMEKEEQDDKPVGDKPQNECYNLEEEVQEDLFKYCIYKHEDVLRSRYVKSWEECKKVIKEHGWEMGSAYSTQHTKWFANLYREDYGDVSLVFVQVR